MKYISILFVLCCISGWTDDHPVLQTFNSAIQSYNLKFPSEKAYVITDRTIYRPGEDVWFRGIVYNLPDKNSTFNSDDFIVKLLNNNGEEIIHRRYPLNEGVIAGSLNIPRTLVPGRYWLVSYTSWMRNQSPEDVFRKEILVSRYFDKRIQLDVLFDKISYFPGDTLFADLHVFNHNNKPVTNADLEFKLSTPYDDIITGDGKTDEKGYSKVSCPIPSVDDVLMLTVFVRNRQVIGNYSIIIPTSTEEPQVTFYPEGGKIIKGVQNRVVFKVTDKEGQPCLIRGKILDESGKLIKNVSTSDKGIGVVTFIPSGNACYLEISEPASVSRKFQLPECENNGFTIQLKNKNTGGLEFQVSSTYKNNSVSTYWVATVNREIIGFEEVNFTDSTLVLLPINDSIKGIVQVSVFNENLALVAERMVSFGIDFNNLKVQLDHEKYNSRQRVYVILNCDCISEVMDLSFSVSLLNLSPQTHSDNISSVSYSVQADTSIYQPGKGTLMDDIELITIQQGPINWKDLLNGSVSDNEYQKMDGISGYVVDKKEVPSQHAKVRITHIPNYRTYETQADSKGYFQVMFGSDIIDYKYLNIDAWDATGKTALQPMIDQEFAKSVTRIVSRFKEGDRQLILKDLISYGEPKLTYALRYSPRKLRRLDKETGRKFNPEQYAGYSNVLDIIRDIKDFRIVNNSIVFLEEGIHSENPMAHQEAIIVINGVLKGVRTDLLKDISPSDITNISISTSLTEIHKYTLSDFNAVIEVNTIQGKLRYRQPTFQIGSDILNANRSFYSPDYSVESTVSTDNRKTLYWNPNLIIQPGKSELITFFTSDIKGTFYGKIEGTDSAGHPVVADFTFVVE